MRVTGDSSIDIVAALGIKACSNNAAHFVDDQIDLGVPLGRVPVRVLLWPTSRSYTGQPSAEIHTFGSLPLLQGIVSAIIALGGRAARPGEFTLRAFLAGRLDLTQAEAVLGVIDAEQRSSLDHALRQLAGNLSRPVEFLRSQLLDLLADVEAGLDFVDEDIQFISDADLTHRLDAILSAVESTRLQLAQRAQDKQETIITLRGLPNAGKSRLLNAICGTSAAIVADVSGTTRDTVRVQTQLSTHSAVLIDTAGIEDSDGDSLVAKVSALAQQHAKQADADADIRLWCVDHSDVDWQSIATELKKLAAEGERRELIDLWIATKCDDRQKAPEGWIATSSINGYGLEELRRTLFETIESLDQSESTSVVGTAARCSGSLRAAEEAIRAAIDYVAGRDGHEYVSAELRLAAAAIGEVTGAVYTDDILDRVFSRFCIGK